jgi:lactam utilization protein B
MSYDDFPRIETDCDDHERIRSWFFGDDFAVLPNVDRRAVHAGSLAGDLAARRRARPTAAENSLLL